MSYTDDFVIKYFPHAVKTQKEYGLNLTFTLAQAALESRWGKSVAGNNMFGVKADAGWTGQKQLITTVEVFPKDKEAYYRGVYSKNGRSVISVEDYSKKPGYLLFTVKDWFRVYPTPADSFNDRAKFFFENSRYKNALAVRSNAYRFAQAIFDAGYATGASYVETLHSIIKSVEGILKKNVAALDEPAKESSGLVWKIGLASAATAVLLTPLVIKKKIPYPVYPAINYSPRWLLAQGVWF